MRSAASVLRPAQERRRAPALLWLRVHATPAPVLATAWLVLIVLAAIAAPWIGLRSPIDGDLMDTLTPPNADYWFGTDSLGRDIFSRSIYGARVSFFVATGSVSIGLLFGGALGLAAGYFSGVVDRIVMGAMTVVLCFPALILAIAIVSNLGPGLGNVTITIGFLFVPAFARIGRANTLVFREREFVLAAQALGAMVPRILLREILPNLMPALLSYALVMLSVAILAEAALGFLGLSVRPPEPSWGGMVASERGNLGEAPHAVFIPALLMFLSVLAINILGERARRWFDIKSQAL
ncbi:MAG: ABC transporter permease [Betaproteobacteria bacterium]|nr:ABC transporter permease [Betaproteobacteria bacterium]